MRFTAIGGAVWLAPPDWGGAGHNAVPTNDGIPAGWLPERAKPRETAPADSGDELEVDPGVFQQLSN